MLVSLMKYDICGQVERHRWSGWKEREAMRLHILQQNSQLLSNDKSVVVHYFYNVSIHVFHPPLPLTTISLSLP
jgi:hypothetical protein